MNIAINLNLYALLLIAGIFMSDYAVANTPPNTATSDALSAGTVIDVNSLTSTQVLQIEQTLKNKGFETPLDGVWSPGVTAALQQFQMSRNLPANGQLTGQSAASLGVIMGGGPPPPP